MSDPTFSGLVWSTVSGVVAIFAGTGLSWYFFVSPRLKDLELYKEKVSVFRKVGELITQIERSASMLKDDPDHVGEFGEDLERFNSYVRGKNRLFLPRCVKESFPVLIQAQQQVTIPPGDFSDRISAQRPSNEDLDNLVSQFSALRDSAENEIMGQGSLFTEAMGRINEKWGRSSLEVIMSKFRSRGGRQ